MTFLEGMAPAPLSHFFLQEKGFKVSLISHQKNHTGEWVWKVSYHEKSSCQSLQFTRKNIADPKVIKPLEMRFNSVHGTGCFCPIFSFCLPWKLSGWQEHRFLMYKESKKNEKRLHLFELLKTQQSLCTAVQLEQATSLWRSQHCSSFTAELGQCPSTSMTHPDRPPTKAALASRKV